MRHGGCRCAGAVRSLVPIDCQIVRSFTGHMIHRLFQSVHRVDPTIIVDRGNKEHSPTTQPSRGRLSSRSLTSRAQNTPTRIVTIKEIARIPAVLGSCLSGHRDTFASSRVCVISRAMRRNRGETRPTTGMHLDICNARYN